MLYSGHKKYLFTFSVLKKMKYLIIILLTFFFVGCAPDKAQQVETVETVVTVNSKDSLVCEFEEFTNDIELAGQLDSSNFCTYNRLNYRSDGLIMLVDTTMPLSWHELLPKRTRDAATARAIRRAYWKKHL
jgi:hypothetical protein